MGTTLKGGISNLTSFSYRETYLMTVRFKQSCLLWKERHYSGTNTTPLRMGGFYNLKWSSYLAEMKDRFTSDEFDDFFWELLELHQTGYVHEYYEDFVSILNYLQFCPRYALMAFIHNLKTDIANMDRMFRPKSLNHALHLAKIVESNLNPSHKKNNSPYKTITSSSPTITVVATQYKNGNPHILLSPRFSSNSSAINSKNQTTKNSVAASSKSPSKKPTTAEIEERKRKRLCYSCRVKYVPGHKCVKSQLYQLCKMMIEGQEDDEAEEYVDCEDTPELLMHDYEDQQNPIISLHAILAFQVIIS
ncbi:hypothetical protein COLO4_16106 [Corchorus olitorius]|uniref:Retrotransposon gag protein n=1 Tax=Corchorus olitorius TaxID=93759 RepID=A0A1R3JJK5_9ROSI|nr:hypothetical protein COLO4_16106 [Corchorus olitorius]